MLKIFSLGLAAIAFIFMFSLVFAQEASPLPNTSGPLSSPVEYALPYPGILPDHPLFFIKIIRDRILQFLIKNPVKKCEFQILLADKSLISGMMLLEKNKQDLAIKSYDKAVNSLTQAEHYLFEIPGSDKTQIVNVKDRFEKSLQKHQELLSEVQGKLNDRQNLQVDQLLTKLNLLFQEYQNKK